MELDEALTSRERINAELRNVLDDATDKWGTRVVRVEIQRIDPPADVTQSMHRQMKAEREKRAAILESDGQRQARILEAQGQAQAVREVADAERYRIEQEAEGEARAVERVFSAIMEAQPDEKVIAIKYLDALQVVANGKASKLYLPYEASGVLGALGGIGEMFNDTKKGPDEA